MCCCSHTCAPRRVDCAGIPERSKLLVRKVRKGKPISRFGSSAIVWVRRRHVSPRRQERQGINRHRGGSYRQFTTTNCRFRLRSFFCLPLAFLASWREQRASLHPVADKPARVCGCTPHRYSSFCWNDETAHGAVTVRLLFSRSLRPLRIQCIDVALARQPSMVKSTLRYRATRAAGSCRRSISAIRCETRYSVAACNR